MTAKNTDPKKLDATNIGDCVVIREDDGTERSATMVRMTDDGWATFAWIGKNRLPAYCAMRGERLRDAVLAIFPADCKFLAV